MKYSNQLYIEQYFIILVPLCLCSCVFLFKLKKLLHLAINDLCLNHVFSKQVFHSVCINYSTWNRKHYFATWLYTLYQCHSCKHHVMTVQFHLGLWDVSFQRSQVQVPVQFIPPLWLKRQTSKLFTSYISPSVFSMSDQGVYISKYINCSLNLFYVHSSILWCFTCVFW